MMGFKPTSGLTRSGLQNLQRESGMQIRAVAEGESIFAKKLNMAERRALPQNKSNFVFPERGPGPGSYLIKDRSHAAVALSRAKNTPDFAAVKKAVCAKYGDFPECGGS
jgi:hypothetical protein